jgi:hypothetical protein
MLSTAAFADNDFLLQRYTVKIEESKTIWARLGASTTSRMASRRSARHRFGSAIDAKLSTDVGVGEPRPFTPTSGGGSGDSNRDAIAFLSALALAVQCDGRLEGAVMMR